MAHAASSTARCDVAPSKAAPTHASRRPGRSPRGGWGRRSRAAGRQRGAIFVEAIIVSSMLMTVLAGAIFFHRMYSAKIRAMQEARLAVWQAAEAGCATQMGIGQLFNLVSVDSCVDESCSVGGLDTQTDDGPTWLEMGAQTSEITHSVTAHARAGGQTHSMRAYNRVICNERRQNARGDLASIGEYILDAVIQ